MMISQTKDKLQQLRLQAFIDVLEELTINADHQLSIADAVGMMADRELVQRENRRLERLLTAAKLRYPDSCISGIDYHQARELNRDKMQSLYQGDWLERGRNIIFIGPTGVGKSYLACALGRMACEKMLTVRYYRVGRLVEQLRISHADGSYQRQLEQLAKIRLLILDDWGIDQLDRQGRRDILEVLEDRAEKQSTIITTQLPADQWHGFIGDNTIADAICDRVINNAYKLVITGESMRKKNLTHVEQSVL